MCRVHAARTEAALGTDLFGRLVDLVIKLGEVRAANRRQVWSDCVQPLGEGLLALHQEYIANFTTYSRRIDENGVSREVLRALEYDLNSVLTRRTRIYSVLAATRTIARKKVDDSGGLVDAYCDSILDYLDPKGFREHAAAHHVDVERDRAEQLASRATAVGKAIALTARVWPSLFEAKNPMYNATRAALLSGWGAAEVKDLVLTILKGFHERYAVIQDRESALRAWLLG